MSNHVKMSVLLSTIGSIFLSIILRILDNYIKHLLCIHHSCMIREKSHRKDFQSDEKGLFEMQIKITCSSESRNKFL